MFPRDKSLNPKTNLFALRCTFKALKYIKHTKEPGVKGRRGMRISMLCTNR